MKRTQYLFLSTLSLSLVIFAVILQQTGYQGVSFLPCPLCILQRVGYLGIAISCLLAAGLAPLRRLFHGLALLAAGYGVAVAGHHVWLLFHPSESCGIDPLETWINQFQLANYLPWLFKADGLCSAKLPAILGLQVPEWSLLWFSALCLILLITFFRKSKS
ncbi:disulfide bond formation protein B [Polynucleobacter sp. JS-Safj-400b-B2]|uniref:disulfide bond formation protein B n=1 Tax=unclassified Polynucleobacter TaxID=2640945 RepID=UPI001BFE84B3|nr:MULTISPECIES: disulfide bond formation protein B [unclassified Polynucleobacter]MBU3624741.1 disulfide bond formation protein B [Polynucleobacter sp. JS-Safj-400b-B2]QWD68788.1 disulfide bond formation protein B [Polynucleobacter sp. VK25]